MPQVLALVVAAAGIYAGLKWAARLIADAERTPARADKERREAMARGAGGAKDLGTLEFDAESGVYRPRGK